MIYDSIFIAWTKFKSRKFRSLVSALIGSVMLLILLVGSLASTGVGRSIDAITGISGRYLLKQTAPFFLSIPDEEDLNTDSLNYVFDTQQIRDEFSEFEILDIHRTIELAQSFVFQDQLLVNGEPIPAGDALSFDARSASLLEDRLEPGQTIELGDDGSLPLFINTALMTRLEGVNLEPLSAQERVSELERFRSQYAGTLLVLSDSFSDAEVTARVVGIAPNDSISGFDSGSFFVLESLGEQQRQALNILFSRVSISGGEESLSLAGTTTEEGEIINYFSDSSISETIFEFSGASELKRFRSENRCGIFDLSEECRDYLLIGNASLEYEEIIDIIWGVLRYVVYFFSVVTALFIFFSTSKITADSRKETGVFRAIGARRSDIASIYLLYVSMITTLSFIIAFVGALIIASIMNNRFSTELATQLASYTGTFGDAVSISFIGINPVQLLGIWLISLVVGFVGGSVPIWQNTFASPIKAIRSE